MNTDIAKRSVQVLEKVLEKYNLPFREKKSNGISITRTKNVLTVHDTVSQLSLQTYEQYSFYLKENRIIQDNFAYIDNNGVAFKCIKTNKFYNHTINFADTFKDDYFSLSTIIDTNALDIVLISIALRENFSNDFTSFSVFGTITDDFISRVQDALNE